MDHSASTISLVSSGQTANGKQVPLSSDGVVNPAFQLTPENIQLPILKPPIRRDTFLYRIEPNPSLQTIRRRTLTGSSRVSNVLRVVDSTVWFTCLLSTIFVPIFMVIIGVIYLGSCPSLPSIPILLITIGSLITLSNLLNAINQLLTNYTIKVVTSDATRKTLIASLNVTINSFVFMSFLLSCLWIYGSSRPTTGLTNTEQTNSHYCHSLPYYLLRWTANAIWMSLTALIVSVILASTYATFRLKAKTK